MTTASHAGPIVVLLMGHNCAGKSTVGSIIAADLSFSAFIEVDELHYKIRSGRVAWSEGISPLEQPEEYRRQRQLAEDGAVKLALTFLEAGFNCIIDNLSQASALDAAWAAKAFPGRRVIRVLLFCDDKTLQSRLQTRHGCSYRAQVGHSSDRALNSARTFDLTVDTSCNSPRFVASRIIADLGLVGSVREFLSAPIKPSVVEPERQNICFLTPTT